MFPAKAPTTRTFFQRRFLISAPARDLRPPLYRFTQGTAAILSPPIRTLSSTHWAATLTSTVKAHAVIIMASNSNRYGQNIPPLHAGPEAVRLVVVEIEYPPQGYLRTQTPNHVPRCIADERSGLGLQIKLKAEHIMYLPPSTHCHILYHTPQRKPVMETRPRRTRERPIDDRAPPTGSRKARARPERRAC